MKVALSAAAIALAALATTACGANPSSGNGSAAGGNGSGTAAAIVGWEGSSGETAASALQDFFAPAAVSDARQDATTRFQVDARNIRGDLRRMKKTPPPADTSEWDAAISCYSTAVADLTAGNSSAAVSKLNAGSASIVTFGYAVDDADLQA